MGQFVVSAASGQGSASIGGTFNLTEFDVLVTTLADSASAIGAPGIRRIHQQGWIGVGITPGGGPFSGIVALSDSRYVELESELKLYNPNQPVPCDTIYWDIKNGGVVMIEVDW